MKSISKYISDILWNKGIIQKEDIDSCKYGLDIFFSSFIEIFSILVISAIVGNIIETILLFTAFIPLRIYAGGYHADTKIRCYILSLLMYIIFCIILSIVSCKQYLKMSVLCTIFTCALVIFKAPIIHCNKEVNNVERKNYRKMSIKICVIETMVILLLIIIIPKSTCIISLAIGQASVAVSMIAAIVKGVTKF